MACPREKVDVRLRFEEDDEGPREGGLRGGVIWAGSGTGGSPWIVGRGGKVGEDSLRNGFFFGVEPEAFSKEATAGPDDAALGAKKFVMIFTAFFLADNDFPGIGRCGRI